ncbi:universal stress protein [Horticoccus sp. 23ND18S-11]|uniref:universal stress protein n=1 Tax=Horticoccus sp. 23ND18S-11 TaxID=3391832 RepID=UPI0039C964B6
MLPPWRSPNRAEFLSRSTFPRPHSQPFGPPSCWPPGLKRALVGSVAERVVRHAPCPSLPCGWKEPAERLGTMRGHLP